MAQKRLMVLRDRGTWRIANPQLDCNGLKIRPGDVGFTNLLHVICTKASNQA